MTRAWPVLLLALIAFALPDCGSGWQPRQDCGRTGTACTVHGDCCSFACNGTCACAPQGEHCLADVACCGGSICLDEMCVQGCRNVGVGCDNDSDCCIGRCADGRCSDECGMVGDSCEGIANCCTGLDCYLAQCVPANCPRAGQACSATNPCCAGLPCENGTCRECTAEGGTCTSDYTCCTGLVCDPTGHCAPCAASGSTCSGASGCCSPSSCQSNLCCRLPTETCTTESECCIVMFGTVVDARCPSQGRCCHAPSSRCMTNSDCCSGTCSGLTCTCLPLGSECQDVFDCCSGTTCSAGKCCKATNQSCTLNTECCSGMCKANNQCA